jgi:hypothetical protein
LTLLLLTIETKDKLTFAQEAFEDKKLADAIYLACQFL